MSFFLIRNLFNKGLCTAFNQALAHAKGKYVIDLSGDDILLANRIEKQVDVFENLTEEYAVIFSNARYIDQHTKRLNFHYPVNTEEKSILKVPTGDVYKNILERYFICTPTMMMRTSVVRDLEGYDESLKFEDFDFWIPQQLNINIFIRTKF